ncbi:hypothetical protein mRhiFer1_010248 [Rhinolophus ferrumequinum]|uniref:Uncharacterized protein n=1 Tax=Rhinolophus ferrumequinum TaxID=59479 RepID=A0A7J7X5J3_RHIFE|nr:hypothetical protein mRhiFer1_010248 [Rhinolophus ferrumequinum]
MNEALSLFSQMLRTQRGHARRQSPKPQVGSQPSAVKREARWGQAGPIHAGPSKPTPASLSSSHVSSAAPRPHHQSLTWSQHPRASRGVQVLCCTLPGFSALACPGLLTRASTPRQQPTREQGRRRLGLWSPPPQAPDFLVLGWLRPGHLQQIVGPGCLPTFLTHSKVGTSWLLTSLQALPRGALGSERWSSSLEGGQWNR